MRKTLWLLTIGLLVGLPAFAQTPEVALTRIDCGTDAQPRDVARFSDIFAFQTLKLEFTFSCYLIKHGDEYMVWDTGFLPGANPNAPKTSLVDYLAQLKVTPDQIKYVGISHYHGDHTGQLPAFPKAMLLIGQGDWDAVTAPKPAQGVNAAAFAQWTTGASKYEALSVDKDVFGDGTVIILRTPGHTPGHSSLLVRLKETGPVLLTGDLTHFRENYDANGVPVFNTDRAQSIASLDRFKKIAEALKAMVIIQHDMRDIAKLPAFPSAAK